MIRRGGMWLLMGGVATLPGLIPPDAHAQAYPSKPVRFIVPFAAGGSADIVARVLALGVTAATRSPAQPAAPAIAETAPGFDISTYYSAHVPAGTPKDIVARLYAAFAKVLLAPDIRERLAADGAEVVANTPDEFAAQLKAELARWGPIIRESGVRVE